MSETERLPLADPPQEPRLDGSLVRFGVFEMDLTTGELRKGGSLVKLRQQPFKVLAYLALKPGRLVTRGELRAEIWGGDNTYVDFDQGLNYCIKEIRAVLGDSAETPLYVETLPRRGYRFIAPIVAPPGLPCVPDGQPALAEVPRAHTPIRRRVLGLLALVAAAAAGWLLAPRPAPETSDWRRITFRRGALSAARFGPGDEVVFSAAWDGGEAALYSAATGSPEARAVPITKARLVAVSRRGEVAFIQAPPGSAPVLARAPLAGGPVKQVLERVSAADMTPDGTAFAVARLVPGRGTLIEYPIGRVLGATNEASHLRISPDGQRIAYVEHPVHGDDRGYVVVLAHDGRRLAISSMFASMEGLAWLPTSDSVLFTASRGGLSSALLSVDLKGRERMLVPATGRVVIHDVASDGRALLERCSVRGAVGLMGETGEERDLSWFDSSSGVALSADGNHVLITESGDAGGPGYAVYLRSVDGSDPVRLGSGAATALSPDGRLALAIPVRAADHIDLLPAGAGEARVLRHRGIVQYSWAAFTPDGGRLVFSGGQRDRNMRVWVGDLEGGAPRPITPEGLVLEHDTLSPDGRSIVAPCRPLNWCVYPLDGGEPTPVPGIAGFLPVAFAPSGKTLIVRPRAGGIPLLLEQLDLARGRREPWRALAPRDRVGVGSLSGIVVSRDGRALVANYARRLSELYLVEASALRQ